jgi:hypothetical protein
VKIKETIERRCCTDDDLLPFRGELANNADRQRLKLRFCRHCGQLWQWDRKPGDMDYTYHRLLIKDWE